MVGSHHICQVGHMVETHHIGKVALIWWVTTIFPKLG
jgi:hypothetical protein